MTMQIPAAQTSQMRRARALYGALGTGRAKAARSSAQPRGGRMLAEWAALAVFALSAAGIIALRAWFAAS